MRERDKAQSILNVHSYCELFMLHTSPQRTLSSQHLADQGLESQAQPSLLQQHWYAPGWCVGDPVRRKKEEDNREKEHVSKERPKWVGYLLTSCILADPLVLETTPVNREKFL